MKRSHKAAAVLAIVPVAVSLLAIIPLNLHSRSSFRLPCWILTAESSAVVLPSRSACPLEFLDTIVGIEAPDGTQHSPAELADLLAHSIGPGDSILVNIVRNDGPLSRAVGVIAVSANDTARQAMGAVLLASTLMWIPMLLLGRSASPAAAPLAFFYSAIVVVGIAAIAGQHLRWVTVGAAAALTFVPATLAHLSLVFPTRGKTTRRVPEIVAVPYISGAVLGAIALLSLQGRPLLLSSFVYLLIAAYGMAWAVLMASCAFTLRESQAPAERARSRLVFLGALIFNRTETSFLI